MRIYQRNLKTPESAKSTNSGVYVVIVSGFEPLAFRLGGGRSIQLSYTIKTDRHYNTLSITSKYPINNSHAI